MALGTPSPCSPDLPWQCRLGRVVWHSLCTGRRSRLCCSGGSPGLLALPMACLLPPWLCCCCRSCWGSLLTTKPGSLSLPLFRQKMMHHSQGAASPDSQAPCVALFGQVIDSSVILLNGSCIGIQGHLQIRQTRSLAVIGPPCVR